MRITESTALNYGRLFIVSTFGASYLFASWDGLIWCTIGVALGVIQGSIWAAFRS